MNVKKKIYTFIVRAFTFIIISFALLLMVILFSNEYLKKSDIGYLIDDNIENLILGHSHVVYAYNDSIVLNSLNLGQDGDSYYYMYLKAKQIINCNPHINNVFIEFSNNLIDVKMDQWIWDDIHLNYKFTKLSAFADYEDSKLLIGHNLKGYLTSLSLATRKNINILLNPPDHIIKEKDWGGFEALFKTDIDSLIIMNQEHKLNPKTPYRYRFSSYNISYLKKLILMLKNYNIKVYLIRTPVHEMYHYLNNQPQFDSIYKHDFDSIPFLDFQGYPLLNNQFADDSHLNSKGANDLSTFFQNLIDLGILEQYLPQHIIDSVVAMKIEERKHLYKKNYGYTETDTIVGH